ncbi:MAG: tubulin-like doman-containing protein [Candidatus Nanopelagicales bacterium]
MRRFLVVGCGGSGGGTLRFLMDQLRADLSAHGVDELPAGWQFLHIDVPVVADSGPGLLGSVPDQGGEYLSLSYPHAQFADISAAVDRQFRVNSGMNGLASWRPNPSSVTVDITDGAGQYRAIGRVLTLHRSRDGILPALRAAWNRLQAASVHHEMASLVHDAKVPGLGDFKAGAPPIVLVVSSMAGGSGASMVLDVARMLNMIEGVSPGHIGLFLYSPEVFAALKADDRTGVEANGAAALAELIAAQARADDVVEATGRPDRTDAFRALGMVGAGHRQSFGSVFPFGAMIGDTGAKLGDGMPETIYRALGRGLAALMLAGEATEAFAQYDLTNKGVVADREQFGWGVEPSNVAWGSFGFASLSLGRERYAEFSAQRIARVATDRLALGHMQPGEIRNGTEVVRNLVDTQLPHVLARLSLPQVGEASNNWFAAMALPKDASVPVARSLAAASVEPFIVADRVGNNADQWLTAVTSQVGQREGEVRSQIEHAAHQWGVSWYKALVRRVEDEIGAAVSTLGLPYAAALLERLRHHADAVAIDMARAGSANPNPVVLPAQESAKLDSWRRARGAVVNPTELSRTVLNGYVTSINSALRVRVAVLTAALVGALGDDLYKPLEQAVRGALQDVENARSAPTGQVGIAQVRTAEYAAWPDDGQENVPGRFAHAENEVLLTAPAEYPALFSSHLRAIYPAATAAEQRERAAEAVIRGRWDSISGTPAPDDLLECRAAWRPAALPTDPETRRPIVPARARYDLHTSTEALLVRARLFVQRAGEPFERYNRESLTDFVTDPDLSQAQRAERERLIVDSFREACNLSRPVVGVSQSAAAHLHQGLSRSDRRPHKFGQIPFQGMSIESQLLEVLKDPAEGFSETTVTNFGRALAPASTATRIDIFGSNPSYFPLVFTSFLHPITARWAAASEPARIEFWKWRRARPLPEFLPVGQAHRRALVAGWFLGRVCGMIKVPDDFGTPGADPTQVWDTKTATWLAFPEPLLVPRRELVDHSDAMAAILESMVLAIASSHESPHQEPLRPYTALRRLFDESAQTPTPEYAIDPPVGAFHMARWLADGHTRSGESVIDSSPDMTPQERAAAVLEWLGDVREDFASWAADCAETVRPDRPRRTDLTADAEWAIDALTKYAKNPPKLVPREPEQPVAKPPARRPGRRL